jgi:transposase InsO family protein
MNDILDNLFYKEKLGIGNKTTFIKKVRERHPEIKVKDINEYLKNQEVSQINTTVNKTYQYKITAPPRTFQIDIFWWKRGETLIPILLLVDILSRKAWAYVLTKSKQEKRAEVSVKTLEEFKNEVGQINGLTGDNEFSSAAIRKFCEDNNIRLDTSVAKEEHISNGNKLGIIDRLVRTLRELIEKYYDITGYRTDNIKDVIASVIETYNNNSHRTLKNKTPNQVYKDNDDQTARHLNDTAHNQAIYKSVPFNDGELF